MTNVSVLTGGLLPSGVGLDSEKQVKALQTVIKDDLGPFTWAEQVGFLWAEPLEPV